MRVLLHSCCGPCVSGCMEMLAAERIGITLLWYNPNIHPYTEYAHRKESFLQLCASENQQPIIIDEYGLRDFIRGIGSNLETGPASDNAERCRYCYRTRLERTAREACKHGFDTFSTSLLVSPYQQHDVIRTLGEEIAEQYRIGFFYRDFRPHFRPGQARARSMGLYMQKYCGCIFSEEERFAKKEARNEK